MNVVHLVLAGVLFFSAVAPTKDIRAGVSLFVAYVQGINTDLL